MIEPIRKSSTELGGLSKIMPVASTYFIVAAMASMGIPCLASFWGELVVFISAFKVYPVRGAMAIVALVISALFMLRVVQKTFYGPKNEQYEHLPDVPFRPGGAPHDPGCGSGVFWTLSVSAV